MLLILVQINFMFADICTYIVSISCYNHFVKLQIFFFKQSRIGIILLKRGMIQEKEYLKLIRHTKGPGKCVGLYRMSEYSALILVNLYFGTIHFCRMSQDVGKLGCLIAQVAMYIQS